MNTERKYRKPLNRNGWMSKLQKLCFGKATPQFVGYCPFFWFTWLCLILFPLFVSIRLFANIIAFIANVIGDAKSTIARRPSDEDLRRYYVHYIDAVAMYVQYGHQNPGQLALQWDRENNEQFAKIIAWIDQTPNWENCAKQVLLRHQQKEAKKTARNEANAARAKKLSEYSGYIARPVATLAIVFLTFWFVKFVILVILNVTFKMLIDAAMFIGAVLVALTCMFIVFRVIRFIYRLFRKCPDKPEYEGFWYRALTLAADGMERFGDFIIETIKTVYTRECPLIEWTDESRPIERNE